jgi:hypothetical protein
MSAARDVLQENLENQAGNWIQVAGEGFASDPQRFERYGATPGERVYYEGRFLPMRGSHQAAADLQVSAVSCGVPVREAPDECQQRLA